MFEQNALKYVYITSLQLKKQQPEMFCKKVVFKISQNSQESACVGVPF